jgi:hypothetical protein
MPPGHSLPSLMMSPCNSMDSALHKWSKDMIGVFPHSHLPSNHRAQLHAIELATASLSLTRLDYAAVTAGDVQVLDTQRLDQQAQLEEVQAHWQRFVDVVKLLLAADGRVDMQEQHI